MTKLVLPLPTLPITAVSEPRARRRVMSCRITLLCSDEDEDEDEDDDEENESGDDEDGEEDEGDADDDDDEAGVDGDGFDWSVFGLISDSSIAVSSDLFSSALFSPATATAFSCFLSLLPCSVSGVLAAPSVDAEPATAAQAKVPTEISIGNS